MDPKIKAEKTKMWQGKLVGLEHDLEAVSKRKGEAAAMGDLSENAAYQMAIEDAEMYRTRISEVRKILAKLEEE